MVIGDVSFADVSEALAQAQEAIGREVNPSVYTPTDFRAKVTAKRHFLRSVLKGGKIFLIGTSVSFGDWLRSRWLVKHGRSSEEIAGLLAIVERDIANVKVAGLAHDWKFNIAYDAALQAATAALAAAGFRAACQWKWKADVLFRWVGNRKWIYRYVGTSPEVARLGGRAGAARTGIWRGFLVARTSQPVCQGTSGLAK